MVSIANLCRCLLLHTYAVCTVGVVSVLDHELESADGTILLAVVAIVYYICDLILQVNGNAPRRLGCPTIKRKRPTMEELFSKYSPAFLRRTYRMRHDSFWRLLDIVEPHMRLPPKRKRGKTINGDIVPALRLSMALRYFAGGDPGDIGPLHGCHPNEVTKSAFIVVNAIHKSQELAISFPRRHDEQERIASEFCQKSAVNFWNCVGAIDGILIWTHRPTWPELTMLGYGASKFYCGRKKKFGVSMQAVCDAKGRFIDYEIKHPGATADYLAFTTSRLYHKIVAAGPDGTPFIKPGLALYGDNAYVNASFMCVPFKGVSDGPKDAYNFYQSQVRINIECAFGMLVQRFGILRKPIAVNISILKTNALVGALCKLHNFCINERDMPPQPTANQVADIVSIGGFTLPSFDGQAGDYQYDSRTDRISALLDGGHHFEGLRARMLATRSSIDEENLPSQIMLRYITEHGHRRPTPRGNRN